jgi:hypothetical protein
MVLETLNRDHRETAAVTSAVRPAHAAAGATTPGSATASSRFSAGVLSQGTPASNPAIRSGNSLDSVMPTPVPAAAAAKAPAKPAAKPAPAPAQANKGWQQPTRKVEATPLDQNIRARPQQSNGGPRKVQIRDDKGFPWIAVGLTGLIAVAAAVVLVYAGVVKLPL